VALCVSNGFSTVLDDEDVDCNLRDIAWVGMRCAQRRHGLGLCRARNVRVVVSGVSDARILRAADGRSERIFGSVSVFTNAVGTGKWWW
jgi:hypothetical protein